MEDIDSSVSEKSNILEQSYCEGVKRIAHQRNSSFFQLPKHIIKKRQKAWSKLFDKYDKEIDDYEINMYELGSDVDDDGDDIEKTSEQDTNDGDEKCYFVKNRTPIRKLPALVQYWVDTGNPPFQLNLENDECESSLIEEQKSNPLIIHTPSETEGKRDHSTSFISSVDTAAYILSNTNVTKKADTLAIVEGAKKSDSPIEAKDMRLNASKECKLTNKMSSTSDKDIYNTGSEKTSFLTALNSDNMRDKKLVSSESCDKSLDKLIMQTSVKITDVLPTLEQLDKTFNGNKSDNDELSNIISLKGNYQSTLNQPLVRKKLYTNRASPIDLIISNPKSNLKPRFSTNVLHPALEGTPTINASRTYFRRRTLRYSRKRKSIASNKFKRLSDKSNFNSPRPRKSIRKRSNAKSINSNDDITSDSMKDSDVTNNDGQMKSNEKQEDLIELCKKKNVVVRLERIPDDKLINRDIKVNDIEKLLNLNSNLSVGTIRSTTKSSKSYADVLELDSQESDQSTIIICECFDKSNSLSQEDSQTCSDDESMPSANKYKEKSKKWSRQHIKQSTELQNTDKKISENVNQIIIDDDDFSDVFIGKFNKIANPSVLSEVLALSNNKEKKSSNLNKRKKTEVNIQSPLSQKSNNSENSEDHSWKLQLTFSSDEEDDFIQMIRHNTEISKIRQTQIEDKSATDANKTKEASSNYKNELNPSKFGMIASSDDDEKKIIKIDNISTRKRKSLRIYSRSKNIQTLSSDDETVKIETTLKQKRNSTNSFSKKYNKYSGKTNVKNISPQSSKIKMAPHINVKLNYSEPDSSSENITPPKKLKTTSDDTSSDNKKQAMNNTNSTKESVISLKEDFSKNKKNLNGLIKQNLTMKPDQTFQSKRQRPFNRRSKKGSNVSRNGGHEIKCSPKEHILMKELSISIAKCPNPSEDVVDSGLSSIVSSNDKISKQTSDEKLACSDDLNSISPVEKINKSNRKSLKRKSNMSTGIQQSSTKPRKKLIKKHKSILVTNESDSEDDLTPMTRRQFAINKSNSSNVTNVQEKKNFDTMFPDPINDSEVLEVPVFSRRSRRSRGQNVEKSHINKILSNNKLRNGRVKFHTGMCSDSDSC